MKEPIDLLARLFNMIIALTLLVAFLLVTVLFVNKNPIWLDSLSKAPAKQSVNQAAKLEIVDGIHEPTGLLDGPGMDLVIRHCTGCHSAKLITQNRATARGWEGTIHWMQETQGLWDLGENEDEIINYLATFYAPEDVGRRKNLEVTEWYELN